MAKVTAYVYVVHDGYPVLLQPGDDVPDGVEVTNPAVLDESEADASEGNQEVEPEVTAEDLLTEDAPDAEDEPATEDAPAPRKRTSRRADASE